jgi:hypothetical protein
MRSQVIDALEAHEIRSEAKCVFRNSSFIQGCQEPRTIIRVLTRMWKNLIGYLVLHYSVLVYAPRFQDQVLPQSTIIKHLACRKAGLCIHSNALIELIQTSLR